MSTKRTNQIALAWILLACGISILWGSSLGKPANRWVDFKAVYYGTRCLLEQHNPYNVSELDGVYRAEGGERSSESITAHETVTLFVNLPTTFLLLAPFAMLPWGAAHLLWIIFTAGSLVFAAALMWNSGASYAPVISVGLISLILANSETLFLTGNTAGIVVSLCVVAVWCFLRERFVLAGILCLALSLAIKPHDAGLVWLYFLLAGGVYRKRALQALLVTGILGLFAFLWVSHIAPHWTQDWYSNMSAISARGGLNEPGPASRIGRSPGMIFDLQAAICVFWDDPRIYNLVSYLFCGALLLAWAARTLRSQFSQSRAWLALAAVTVFTMLVTYHRSYDAKLLLLTVPACAILWAEGGLTAWLALLVTTAGIVSTGDIPLTLLLIHTKDLPISTAGLSGQIRTVLLMEPTPLILLAMGIFYLWIYVRRNSAREETPLATTET
jgi:Glycosyltransferase family 87